MRALELVGHIVMFSEEYGNPVTNLRLQPLLYFVQKESLLRLRYPAFEDNIIAWQYGPVIPEVYFSFSYYADAPIIDVEILSSVCKDIQNIIEDVVRKYKDIPTWKLVDMTHMIGSPWSKAIATHRSTISLDDLVALPI